MPAMDAYTLNLVFLFVALLCQVLISGTSVECWLRRDLPRPQRFAWLALSLAGLLFALHNGYALELAVRTGLYDFRQATLSMLAGLLAAFAVHRFRQQAEYIVWGSNGDMPISRPVSCLPGVFRYGNPQNRIHVTEKPLQLMKDVIQICEPGGRILDPFAGAGTTILAAVEEGYEAVGIEVTDAYYKLGSDRVKFALEAKEKEESEK